MEIYSLYELNSYIKQVVALNFVDTMWIACEISQVSESRGHCYLNLVEKDEKTNQVKAQISAAIWYREYSFIRKKMGKLADQILQDGMQVKLKVEVDFHERYGIKLIIKDIDPSYTYGQLAIQREQIIERLQKENRMKRNLEVPFPSVIQKIAVISSGTAAGFQDLMSQLSNNQYQYDFQSKLFPAAMQGSRTEMEVVAQLRAINLLNDYQLVIITRGGGSKLDLSAFDSYEIAKQISEMSIPVITGIGHDIDQSIADMVSAIAMKTPTAVATFIIDHNAAFESAIYDMAINIKLASQLKFQRIHEFLNQYGTTMRQTLQNNLNRKKEHLSRIQMDIPLRLKNIIQRKYRTLENWESVNKLIHPERLLEKGYSLTEVNGKIVQSVKDVKKGDIITTKLKDGKIKSTIK